MSSSSPPTQTPPPTPPPLPTTTKAWTFHHPGPYRQTLSLTTTHPLPPFPPPATNEEYLLLRISHAALNPADLVTLSVLPFILRSHRHTNPAAVPALDFTATVLDVWHPPTSTSNPAPDTAGSDQAAAPRFTPGDSVVCFPPLSHALSTGVGALQGVVALPARYAVRLPAGQAGLPLLREAAGLLLAGCTADVQVGQCGVREGQRVLVVGASGGVGSMVVQMVRGRVHGSRGEGGGNGGWVVAVCSGRNREAVEGLGADEVVDYTQYKDLPGELARRFGDRPFDHIIDAYGNQELYKQCARYLKPEGMYNAASIHYSEYTFWALLKSALTLVANTIWPRSTWLGGTGRTWKAASMMDPGLEMMERVVKQFGEGKLRVLVDSEWPFEKVHEALDVVRSGHAAGKVIIKVNEE